MGDLRPDNGGGTPPDEGGNGHSGGLPDLPPEWGTIVIPDDPAELAAEAEALRRELRGVARRARVRSALGLRTGERSQVGIPVVIMTVAILTTLVSLLVVTWGNQPTGTYPFASTEPGATAPATPGTTAARAPTPGAAPASPDLITPLPDLRFTSATGDLVRLGDLTPAILLLIDGCACQRLINDVAVAAPPGVHVLTVARAAPAPSAADPANVLHLADPAGTLRARYASQTSPDGVASAVVVNSSGKVVATITKAAAVGDVKPLNPG